jgi:hypothetical protein
MMVPFDDHALMSEAVPSTTRCEPPPPLEETPEIEETPTQPGQTPSSSSSPTDVRGERRRRHGGG